MFEFYIPGDPVGKERPRFAGGHAYTPAKTKLYEETVQWSFKRAGGKRFSSDAAIAAEILAVYKMPKRAIFGAPARKRPDCDNVAKAVLDALNGVAYDDDASVVELHVKKQYGEPAVYVKLWEVGHDSE